MNRSVTRWACFLSLLLMPLSVSAEMKIKALGVEYQDDKGVALKNPEGVACAGGGLIIAADTGNGRLVRYQLQGETLSPGTEIRLPQIVYPTKLSPISGGDLLVLDGRTRKIVRIAADGTFKGFVEVKGVQLKNAVVPKGVAADASGQIYILDVASLNILVLDPTGTLKRTIPVSEDAAFISDIAVDSRGTIYALDSIGFKVFKITQDKDAFMPIASNLNSYLDFPSNITVDARGGILVTDQNGNALVLLGPDGSFQGRQLTLGWKPGALYYPAQVCVSDTTMAVADRNNNRIQLFTLGK